MSARVLSIGYDPELLEDRHLLLREAGVYVTSILGAAELGNLLLPVRVDTVLIGNEVPPRARIAIANWARQNAPGARVVFMLNQGEADDSLGDERWGCDELTSWIRRLRAQ